MKEKKKRKENLLIEKVGNGIGILKIKALFRSKTWKVEFNWLFFCFYVFILLVEKLVRE